MSTVKNEVSELLKKLPDDCTLEDIQYHLYVLEKARRGEEELLSKVVFSRMNQAAA